MAALQHYRDALLHATQAAAPAVAALERMLKPRPDTEISGRK